jgi:hypothetical protein
MYTLVAPHLVSSDLLRLGIGMMPQMFSRRGELYGDTHYAVVQPEKSGSCSGRLAITVTTMAADGGNAPLTPHTRHCAPRHRLCSMGNDPLIKRI